MMNFMFTRLKMDTCVRVIGVGILELNRNSVGPSLSRLA